MTRFIVRDDVTAIYDSQGVKFMQSAGFKPSLERASHIDPVTDPDSKYHGQLAIFWQGRYIAVFGEATYTDAQGRSFGFDKSMAEARELILLRDFLEGNKKA